MTIEEAIKYAEEVAKENDDSAKEFYRVSKLETHPDRKRAEDGYVECKKCAEEHRQLAEWLRDYKRLKEQEPCSNAISRQAVLNYIYNDLGLGDEENGKDLDRQMELESSYKYIKSLPSVTPQLRIGHWVTLKDEYGDVYEAVCSNCDSNGNHKWAYCPDCGAKMREGEE